MPSKPEIKFNRKTYDGMIVRFWTDDRITLGRMDTYAGLAKYERRLNAEILRWVDTFTSKEIQKMCRTGKLVG